MSSPLKGIPLSHLVEVNPRDFSACNPMPYVGMEDVSEDGRLLRIGTRGQDAISPGQPTFSDGDILFAKITPCMENGKGALVSGLGGRVAQGSTEFHVLRARRGADPCFVYQWTRTPLLRRAAAAMMTGSAGQRRVPPAFFAKFEVPEFDIGEQRRIAEILDALDDCVERSVAVQEKLHVIERGILYDNFSARERSADNWTHRPVAEVGEVKLGRQRSPQHESGKHMTPYLRVANVFEDYIDYSDVLEMNFTPAERSVYGLERGDILLNEGQSLELVGRSAIFDGPPGMCFQNTLVRFRSRLVSPEYAQAVFRYWLHAGEFAKIAKRTTSIAHLGADRFARMSFPVASQEHERRVVDALGALQERSDIERRRTRSLKQLKQGLAEDLLTGRVRVPEAEAVVESL